MTTFCQNVTSLLRAAYPASIRALVNAAGRTRQGQNFIADLIDVAYFFQQIGGPADSLKSMLRFAFHVGSTTAGQAANRIPHEVIYVIDDLAALWGRISPSQYRALIVDMGRQSTKFRGGFGVLRFLRQRGYRNIVGLEIAGGIRRTYDVVLSTGRHYAIEVKSWAEWATARRSQWGDAGWQLARDLLDLQRRGQRDTVWIFYTGLETAAQTTTRTGPQLRRAILEKLFDGIGYSLLRRHRGQITFEALIRRLSNITEANIGRHGTSELRRLLDGPGGIEANRDRLIDALRQLQADSSSLIHIDPT